MTDRRPERVLVIGIGNRFRGDDAAGPAVAEGLGSAGIDAIEHAGEGTQLMALWEGADQVVIVDAMRGRCAPGTVRRFDAVHERLDEGLFAQFSHEIGVAEGVELARTLGRLPSRLTVYGIAGRSFELGEPLSPDVARAVEETVRRIIGELGGQADSAGLRTMNQVGDHRLP